MAGQVVQPLVRRISRDALAKRAMVIARRAPLHVSIAAYRWKVSESTARKALRIAAYLSGGELVYERGVLRSSRGYRSTPTEAEYESAYDKWGREAKRG